MSVSRIQSAKPTPCSRGSSSRRFVTHGTFFCPVPHLLHASFDIARKRLEKKMFRVPVEFAHEKPEFSDEEKICILENILNHHPNDEEAHLLVFNHHWAQELAKHPRSITIMKAQVGLFINTVKLMESAAMEHAHIDGTKVDLIAFGESVGIVNDVLARIQEKALTN